MFFVLSGFLITHLLLREAEQTDGIFLKRFYLRRCLRIMPVYFVYIGVLACLVALKVYFGEVTASWLGAVTFTRNMIGPVASYTGHFWSLAVEEQFYLVWPCCIAMLTLWRRQRDAIKLLLIPIVLCPLIRMANFTPEANGEFCWRVFGSNSILIYADSLAIGCLGAFLMRRITFRPTPETGSLVLAAALSVITLGVFWENIFGKAGGLALGCIPTLQAAAILTAMWISTQHEKSLVYRILNWSPINALGILSYSIYIWHVLFLCNYTGPTWRAYLYDWHYWWLAALVVAAISYYCVERPFLRLKKKVAAKSS